MTKRVLNTVFIESTAPAECSDCGEEAELRPYGKDGAWVCFDCGMKDEQEAINQFSKIISDESLQ